MNEGNLIKLLRMDSVQYYILSDRENTGKFSNRNCVQMEEGGQTGDSEDMLISWDVTTLLGGYPGLLPENNPNI